MSFKINKTNNTYKIRKQNGNFLINNSDILPPTPTPSKTPTKTPTPTNTATPTVTITSSITPTITFTPTPSITTSLTVSPTKTPTPTITQTQNINTLTPTPTNTLTSTPTNTLTPTVSNTTTITPTSTISSTPSTTPSITPSSSSLSNIFKTSNTANYNSCANWDNLSGNVTMVGSNGKNSSYGIYDANGNSWEWTERLWNAGARGLKGGAWNSTADKLLRTYEAIQYPTLISNLVGFRIASSLINPIFNNSISISDTNNTNDDSGIGSVSYTYTISKFLITNSDYIIFLNSIASDDLYAVYNTTMSGDRGGILRSGSSGSYTYSIKTNYENKPVIAINWYNAVRYCNWLSNNKPSGGQNNNTTENGSYQLTGNVGSPSRLNGAAYFIPSADEWQKAAFYKGGSTNAGYWNYATQSNILPTCISSDNIGNGI